MRTANYAQLLELADKAGPIGDCVKKAIKGHRVDVRAAVKEIGAAGFAVVMEDGSHGVWCRVFKGKAKELVAQGFSPLGEDDAFLHAVLGTIRQENAAIEIGKELETLPEKIRSKVQADPVEMQRLETAFIVHGPAAVRGMLGK